MDADLPIPQRVKLLMDQMTLQERARQTYAVHNLPQFTGDFKADLGKTSFGSLKLSGIETDSAEDQVALRRYKLIRTLFLQSQWTVRAGC